MSESARPGETAAAIEWDEAFVRAWDQMTEAQNVFVTGRAGTGKSTLLRLFREDRGADVVVCAPTGVAAVNVDGVTIHSLFGFRPPDWHWNPKFERNDEKRKVFENARCLVIDEISMVTPGLLDAIDVFLRRNRESSAPFGGLQTIFIGDLFQLPPVRPKAPPEGLLFAPRDYATDWFFSADVLDKIDLRVVELEKIHRQNDPEFIAALNAVREGDVTASRLAYFNQRVTQDFDAALDGPYVTLTGTNALAEETNRRKLRELNGEPRAYAAELEGDFPKSQYPADGDLPLKIGAQVMFLRNNRDVWYNGALGTVVHMDEEVVEVRLREEGRGEIVEVGRETWENNELYYDQQSGKIKRSVKGSFRQFPLRLAWAMTIHKSQGKTFSRMALDLGQRAFAHGQTYVALSRCRSLEGLALKRPLLARDVLVDPALRAFLERGER